MKQEQDGREELSAQTGFSGNDLDRCSDRRDDGAWVEAQQADPEARTYLVHGDDVILDRDDMGHRSLFEFSELKHFGPARETVFLGHDGVGAVFATLLGDEPANLTPSRAKGFDLRTMATQALVSNKNLGRLAQAKSLLYWHSRHRFCPNCGQPTQTGAAGWKRTCPACKAEHFPRTDPVVIMLAVDGERCLMGRQPRFPKGMYSALAGFVEGGETLENAVRREIREEAGIETGAVTYLASQPWPFPCSLMIGCLAQATTTAIRVDETELEDARWFSRDEALAMVRGKHPELFAPPKLAIAHHLIAHWAQA